MAAKHCKYEEVIALREKLRSIGVTHETLAETLGVSRTQITLMLSEASPMRTVYRYAIDGAIAKHGWGTP